MARNPPACTHSTSMMPPMKLDMSNLAWENSGDEFVLLPSPGGREKADFGCFTLKSQEAGLGWKRGGTFFWEGSVVLTCSYGNNKCLMQERGEGDARVKTTIYLCNLLLLPQLQSLRLGNITSKRDELLRLSGNILCSFWSLLFNTCAQFRHSSPATVLSVACRVAIISHTHACVITWDQENKHFSVY